MAELTQVQEDNRAVLAKWLGDIGLSGLENDVLSWITANRGPEWIKTEIVKTPTFKQEFPEYEAAIAAGSPMTPGQIMEYRKTVQTLFKDFNLPSGFYDSKDDFVDLISKRLSPEELQTRVKEGFTRVAGAPPEVKNVFQEYFGVQGDSMLATFFLDPERGAKFLADAATQAEIGGAAQQYGFNFNQQEAQRYQELGISGAQARQGLQQAYQLQPLQEETISESQDLTSDALAEGALIGGEAERLATRRQQERRAAFGGGGGSGGSQKGLGLGGT